MSGLGIGDHTLKYTHLEVRATKVKPLPRNLNPKPQLELPQVLRALNTPPSTTNPSKPSRIPKIQEIPGSMTKLSPKPYTQHIKLRFRNLELFSCFKGASLRALLSRHGGALREHRAQAGRARARGDADQGGSVCRAARLVM